MLLINWYNLVSPEQRLTNARSKDCSKSPKLNYQDLGIPHRLFRRDTPQTALVVELLPQWPPILCASLLISIQEMLQQGCMQKEVQWMGRRKGGGQKCTSAETKQSKQKLTWSQIIKSSKNQGENVTVCSCSIWGSSNCLCFVAFSVLNVNYSFGVSSSKGFPPAQTICEVPGVAMDWHRKLKEGPLSEHTHLSPNYIDCSYLYPQKTFIVSLLAKTLSHLQATYLGV